MDVNIILEGRTRFKFPVLPETLEISGSAGNESIETIKQGEVTAIGNRKLRQFEIESFFTANEAAPFCRTKGEEYRTPAECVQIMTEYQEAKEPLKFITEGLNMNAFRVTLEAFSWAYLPGTGDISFTASFKEYRPYGQRAKTLDRAPDLFNTGTAQRTYEAAGGRREPEGWAIGDRVTVSGMYFQSPNGAKALLGAMADMPTDFLAKAWTTALEATYRALSNRVMPLKNRKAVIIDIVKLQLVSTPLDPLTKKEIKSPYCYCIADIATQERIGWVAEDQMVRL
ncbi:MAG: hypothetical protein IJ268_00165 [Proteobacteria bacterium]|nr:hypothetical protein [Pseudomonadota bacterium]